MLRQLTAAVLAALAAAIVLPPGPAIAGPEVPASVVVASAESDTYEPDGTERYVQVLAVETGRAVTVQVNGFTGGPVTCLDGSIVFRFVSLSGSGTGTLEVTGSLNHASASARLDLTEETLAGCPETPTGPRVLPDRPVSLTVDSVSPALRVLTSARVRIPGQQNDMHLQRQTVRGGSGHLTVDTTTNPTTGAAIERYHTIAHGDPATALAMPFLVALAQVDHEGSVVLQARGGLDERSADGPAPGVVLGRFVDVIAETVDRAATTVFALTITDTVIVCDDGELGVRSEQRFGSAPGTLDVGPRYTAATAAAIVPMTEYVLDGCTGSVEQRDLGDQPVSLELAGTGPVLTATQFRVFVAAPDSRGHERVAITGRGSVSGTVRVGGLAVAATFGGIGQRTEMTHRVMTSG